MSITLHSFFPTTFLILPDSCVVLVAPCDFIVVKSLSFAVQRFAHSHSDVVSLPQLPKDANERVTTKLSSFQILDKTWPKQKNNKQTSNIHISYICRSNYLICNVFPFFLKTKTAIIHDIWKNNDPSSGLVFWKVQSLKFSSRFPGGHIDNPEELSLENEDLPTWNRLRVVDSWYIFLEIWLHVSEKTGGSHYLRWVVDDILILEPFIMKDFDGFYTSFQWFAGFIDSMYEYQLKSMT